jgi:exodeoxyribonuclease V alpha subunit
VNQATPSVVLEGSLERVTYANEENGWSVVRVAVAGRKEPVTAVGNLLGAQPGESLRLTGWWVRDKKYGEQFRVASYITVKPATLVGIERYLGSGLVRGIGPAMAARLVKQFGLTTLEVIDTAPNRLREVEGIGPKRSQRIVTAWAEQKEIRQVMVFLQSYGVSATYAVKVYKEYGARAVAVVQENPYRLAIDIYGIGFKTADKIAQALGMPLTSPRRAEAGLLHVLGEFSDEGHIYAPREKLIASAGEVLGIDAAIIEQAIGDMAAAEHVVVEPPSGLLGVADHEAVYLKSLHTAETGTASLL